MILTARPLRERMTLFWHNHFATSLAKVENPVLMQRQNGLLREHALGKFGAMLDAVGKDPAMLVWLDASANRKAKPNENYAREVMELFTLGRGNYTEKDIQEAARAFTGWFVVRDRFSMLPTQHDDGEKTIFGKTGRFRGEDCPGARLFDPAGLLRVPRGEAVSHLRERGRRSLARPALLPLAKSLRGRPTTTSPLLSRTILRSNPASSTSRSGGSGVKSSVELTVGTVRDARDPQADGLGRGAGRLDLDGWAQTLYAPPSVAGWDGGAAWINTTAMLNRTNLALALLGKDDERLGGRCDAKALVSRYGVEPRKFYVDLLVQDVLDQAHCSAPSRSRAQWRSLVLTTPESINPPEPSDRAFGDWLRSRRRRCLSPFDGRRAQTKPSPLSGGGTVA